MNRSVWSVGVIVGLAAMTLLALPSSASANAPSTDLRLSAGFLPSPTPATGGSEFSFDVSAVGGTAIEGASITLTLPSEFAFVSASVDSPTPLSTCSTTGATTTCGLGTITATPQSGPVVYFNVKFGPNVAPNAHYKATASVSGALPDPDPTNNAAYETVRILPTSRLVASVSPTTLIRGRTNWVTITVRNDGPDPAANVTFEYLSLQGQGFDWAPGVNLSWHASRTLQRGQSVSEVFPVRVSASAHRGVITAGPVAPSNFNPQCTAQQCAVRFDLTAEDAAPTLAETGRPTAALLLWGLALLCTGSATTWLGRTRRTA